MQSVQHIEKGCFRLVRNATGSLIYLFPGTELRGSAVTLCPADERRRRADDRAGNLAMLLAAGTVKNRSELAKLAGISRARVSQILSRTNIAPAHPGAKTEAIP